MRSKLIAGKFKHVLEQLQLNISMDRAAHLLVCDSWDHLVQVFKLNGEFVTKFGASGEGGKLKWPQQSSAMVE